MLGIEKIEAKVDVLSTDLALYVGNTATELKSAADAVNAKVSELSSEIEGSREGLEAVNASATHLSTRVDALSDFFAGKFESLRVLFVEKFEAITAANDRVTALSVEAETLRKDAEVLRTRAARAESELKDSKLKVPVLKYDDAKPKQAELALAPDEPSCPRTIDIEPAPAVSSAEPEFAKSDAGGLKVFGTNQPVSVCKWLLGLSAAAAIRAADVVVIGGRRELVICNCLGDHPQVLRVSKDLTDTTHYELVVMDLLRLKDGHGITRSKSDVVTIPAVQTPGTELVLNMRVILRITRELAEIARAKLAQDVPVDLSRYIRHEGFLAPTWVAYGHSIPYGADGGTLLVSKPRRKPGTDLPELEHDYSIVVEGSDGVRLQELGGKRVSTCLKLIGNRELSASK